MSDIPSMFYLPLDLEPETVPLGAEFQVVYAPNPNTREGWRRITFQVVMVKPIRKDRTELIRSYRQKSKCAIDENEARELFLRARHTMPLRQPSE